MNIMKFARTTGFWKNKMMDIMDEDVIDEAFRYVDSLQATGCKLIFHYSLHYYDHSMIKNNFIAKTLQQASLNSVKYDS